MRSFFSVQNHQARIAIDLGGELQPLFYFFAVFISWLLQEVENGRGKKFAARCLFGIGATFVQPGFYFIGLKPGNGRKLVEDCIFNSFFLNLIKGCTQEQENNYDQKRD